MGRSGYTDDCDGLDGVLWRGAVKRAVQGRRGQAFLREMLEALDAMPTKRLIAEDLEVDGEVCAIGTVGKRRGVDMLVLDADEYDVIAKVFGIAPALVREIEYVNDDDFGYGPSPTPEQRFTYVRDWVVRMLAGETP